MKTCVSGWPRIGEGRRLKFAAEDWLAGRIDEEELQTAARNLRLEAWKTMADSGIDEIPSHDFSLYDGMLDLAIRLGAVPRRFLESGARTETELAYAMARGTERLAPWGMKKWFITNYHYIVPELGDDTALGSRRPLAGGEPFFDHWIEASRAGIETLPTLIGPWTFLRLSRYTGKRGLAEFIDSAAEAWSGMVSEARALGIPGLRFEEGALALDVSAEENALFTRLWEPLLDAAGDLRITLGIPFGDIRDSWDTVAALPFDSVALDLADGPGNLDLLRSRGFPKGRELVAGLVNGRNVWALRRDRALETLGELSALVDGPVSLGTSCSLLHVPLSLEGETGLEAALRSRLSFAREKLQELSDTAARAEGASRGLTPLAGAPAILPEAPYRSPPREERRRIQRERFRLPLLPTTTIGSFPQTDRVRSLRSAFRSGKIDNQTYDKAIRALVAGCVAFQEEIGLDVLVHGEFERNDMVEFFAERLEGFAFTRHGWVQSYGTRCVKPPIVAGDVSRAKPMTVDLARYAQSLTKKPVKGMLTGPATILAWSFPREDLHPSESAFQIARALREEVQDLESAGISIIQIDEAALREKMPPRKGDREAYLNWATASFRLVHGGVRAETQIHTHMCYSDFSDILQAIDAMDADVISFEAARSGGDLSETLAAAGFKTEAGPGVWDIHSPRVPPAGELAERILSMARSGAAGDGEWVSRLWVNPDCGLKTRGERETGEALRNMAEAVARAREILGRELPARESPEAAS